jgi:trk system potassium uptake protein
VKVIIVGCGRTGGYMAKELAAKGHNVSVIDRSRLAFEKLGEDFAGKTVIGTGIDEDVLIRAGIKEADALYSLTKGDNTNAMIGQIAKFLYKVPKVIVRMADHRSRDFYEKYIGLPCYCPSMVSARNFLDFLGEGK